MLLKRLELRINNRCKIAFWSWLLISAASSIVQNPGSADKANDLSNWATAMKPQKLFKVCLFTLVDVLLSICVHLWKAAPRLVFWRQSAVSEVLKLSIRFLQNSKMRGYAQSKEYNSWNFRHSGSCYFWKNLTLFIVFAQARFLTTETTKWPQKSHMYAIFCLKNLWVKRSGRIELGI